MCQCWSLCNQANTNAVKLQKRLIVPALFSVVIPFIHENCVGYKDGNLMDAMFVDDKRKSMWMYVEKEVIYRQNGNEWTSTREKFVDMCFIHS